MIRTCWKGALLAAAASAGVAWGQSAPPRGGSAPPAEQVVTFREKGGIAEECRLLKTWTTAQGRTAYLLQCLDTDEKVTVVQNGPTKPGTPDVGINIYRWGNRRMPPDGSPVPPPDEVIYHAVSATEAPAPRRPLGLSRILPASATAAAPPAPAPVPEPVTEAPPPRRRLGLARILPVSATAAAPSAPAVVVEPATEVPPPRRRLGLARILPVSATASAPAPAPVAEPTAEVPPPPRRHGLARILPVSATVVSSPAPVAETTAGCPAGGCDKAPCSYVHRYEKPSLLHFTPGGCVPVRAPDPATNYGYYQTQWHAWPGAAAPAATMNPEGAAAKPQDVPPAPKVLPALHQADAAGPALNP